MEHKTITFILFLLICNQLSNTVQSFSNIYGIGSILFRPRNISIQKLSDEPDESLKKAASFFTDSFWPSKTVSKQKVLTPSQKIAVERLQTLEFRKRYKTGLSFVKSRDRTSELVISRVKKKKKRDDDDNYIIVGCAGVEVDTIPMTSPKDKNSIRSPLMSNLAVSRDFRRVGIAEELIQKVEYLVRKEWGYNECYLYVEKANAPAVKLYRKLGYKVVWENPKARSIKLTDFGSLLDSETELLCMKKDFNKRFFGLF